MSDNILLPEDDETAPAHTGINPAPEETVGDEEFRLTIRKLVLPVRPRGVLAD